MERCKKFKPLKLMVSALLLTSIATPAFANESSQASTFELTASKAVKISRVTGATQEGETIPNPNQTHTNWGLTATDLGIMWDASTDPNNKKIMVAFGDSYDDGWGGFGGGGDPAGWRSNLLALSSDTDLSDGLTFSSMITDEDKPNYAKEIIYSEHNTSGSGDFTAIPTAGVSVGTRHYIHYMQIKNWGANGRWNTNFSEIAFSDDEGQSWTKSGVKWGATSKFAQAAFAEEGGYVYMFGTPAGRFDHAYLARVMEASVLVKEEYEYWNGTDWEKNNEAAAAPVIEAPVSELSVAYNSHYDKWIMTYLNENRYAIVMRSSDSLTGGWSAETEIVKGTDYPGLYGGFIHPWTNDGTDLYFLMSEWGPYNVFLMRSTLNVGTPARNLMTDPSFENQTSDTISPPWILESGKGGIDRTGLGRAGKNNVWLRNASGWNGIKQSVQVDPNTEYKLTGFVRTSQNNNAGYFGVRDASGTIMKEVNFGRYDNYSPLSVRFNSGDNTSVTVFTGMWANGDTWVQADDYMLIVVDSTPPVITLQGESTIEVPLGGTFTDPGATAADNLDGDLTHKIISSGTVDTNIVGTYTLTYNVTDSEENAAAPVTRTVIVKGEDFTVSNVTIKDSNGNVLSSLPQKGLIKASADIRNNSGKTDPVTFVAVLYNKKGKIENISTVSNAIASGAVETFAAGFMMPGNNSGYYLEVFVAESPDSLNPISAVTKLQ